MNEKDSAHIYLEQYEVPIFDTSKDGKRRLITTLLEKDGNYQLVPQNEGLIAVKLS